MRPMQFVRVVIAVSASVTLMASCAAPSGPSTTTTPTTSTTTTPIPATTSTTTTSTTTTTTTATTTMPTTSTTTTTVPVTTTTVAPPSSAVAQVAAGGFHTCVRTFGGAVRCWGFNQAGQLGDGTQVNRRRPVAVSGLTSGVVELAAAWERTCALMSSGGVKCWGRNASGGVGDGTTTDRLAPVDVVGLSSGIVQIAGGDQHACALRGSGAVACWGFNAAGQVGDGTTVDRTSPVDVIGLPPGIRQIAAGGAHTCAVTAAGGVKCWGENYWGELGDGTNVPSSVPVDVVGLTSGVVRVVAGYLHTCALMADGSVRCWGGGGAGQLGNAAALDESVPVAVSALSTQQAQLVSSVVSHNCAIDTVGVARCWGLNSYGQLGTGAIATADPWGSLVPVPVAGLPSTPIGITGGEDHTCALLASRAVYCWGANNVGQLGDGTVVGRTSPAPVLLG